MLVVTTHLMMPIRTVVIAIQFIILELRIIMLDIVTASQQLDRWRKSISSKSPDQLWKRSNIYTRDVVFIETLKHKTFSSPPDPLHSIFRILSQLPHLLIQTTFMVPLTIRVAPQLTGDITPPCSTPVH